MSEEMKIRSRFLDFIQVPLLLTVLFAACNVPVYFFSVTGGLAVTCFVAVYFLVMLFFYRKHQPRIQQELVDYAVQYGSMLRYLIEKSEIPYAILDKNGRILWMNEEFSEITDRPKDSHKSIMSVFPQITKEKLETETELDILLNFDDCILRAHLKRVEMASCQAHRAENKDADEIDTIETKSKSNKRRKALTLAADPAEQYLTTIYLLDETRLHNYKTEIDANRLVTGLIYIDNYDEVSDSIEDVKRSLLMALVDRKVNRFFSPVDGLVKKIDNDKYFVIFQYRYLEELMEEKMHLLQDVKSIKLGSEMAITLSIGIGFAGKSYNKNYEYARAAIELALGRGGDQAVLKLQDKTFYYGANSQLSEKNTRVKARVKAIALREIMIGRDDFYVMGHSISDVDAFGAAVGIFCAARELGKSAHIVLDTVSSSLKPFRDCFTPENGYPEDMIVSSEKALEHFGPRSALIVVDTNRPSYTESPQLLAKARTVVVFDHHRVGEEKITGAVLSYIEPYASSTCEMIAEVLQYFSEDIHLSDAEADVLYAGILIDTNNYMTKTGVRTFEAAAYLRRSGADVTRVRKRLRNDMAAYKARAEAVRRAEVYRGCFAISVCPADNVQSPTIASAQAANELLNIIGIKASFVLTEFNGKIYISSRSIDEINVQRIMERLGGGGHMSTAGAQLTNCSMENAEVIIKTTLDEMIKSGDIVLDKK